MKLPVPAWRWRVGQLALRWRMSIYVLSAVTWITGVLWLLFHYFITTVDSFGFRNPHPAEQWWLIAHAAASFCIMWLFGMLWSNHIVRSWKMEVHRGTGGALFGVTVWLVLTGCARYYVAGERSRPWVEILHWVPGIAALVVFVLHLLTRRSRKAASLAPSQS